MGATQKNKGNTTTSIPASAPAQNAQPTQTPMGTGTLSNIQNAGGGSLSASPIAANQTPAPITASPTELTAQEKSRLKKRQGGKVLQIVKKASAMKGEPSPTPLKKSTSDKVFRGLGIAETVGEGVATTVGGPAGFAVDAAGTAMDLTGTVTDMVSQFSEISSVADTAFSHAGATFSVIGMLGPVKDLVGLVTDSVRQTINIGKLIKSCITDGVDGWAIADQVLDSISLLASLASTGVSGASGIIGMGLSIGGVFSNVFPWIGYVVSTVIGGINLAITTFQSILSFASHAKDIAKAGRGWYKTRKQKRAAKESMEQQQGTGDKLVEKTKSGNLRLAKQDYGKGGSQNKRKKRLDEYTAEQRTGGGNEEALTSLENYDISKELEQSNKKRVMETSMDVLIDDLAPIVSSAVAIIPGGIGSVGSMGLGLLTSGVSAARAGVKIGKKIGRALHVPGFSKNKTIKKKELRRHNLAVTVFKRIRGLDRYGLENMQENVTGVDEVSNVRQAMGEYDMVSDWVKGMGVMYKTLLKADNPDGMVETMRDGFYSGV